MKTLKTSCRDIKKSLIILLISLLAGCQTDQEQIVPENIDLSKSKAEKSLQLKDLEPGTMIDFKGTLNYYTYAVKLKEVLQDVTFQCLATLEILEHNEIYLHITEYAVGEIRLYTLEGKLTNGGKLKVHHPAPMGIMPDGTELYITDIIKGHTGCELFGPGIVDGVLVFSGKFDGEKIVAPATFISQCDVEWPDNNLFETPVDGPVKWKWEFNFEVL